MGVDSLKIDAACERWAIELKGDFLSFRACIIYDLTYISIELDLMI
jgi:hypothetical protein